MIKEFLIHIFPKVVLKNNLKIMYTFCLGGFAIVTFILLLCSGLLLSIYYIPTITEAYKSILFIEEKVFLGKYIRNIHYISGIFYLNFIFLHMLRVIYTSAFTRGYNFMIGLMLLFLSIFEGYTGYILPMDQISFWAGITGSELVKLLPFGEEIVNILLPDRLLGNLSLVRLYILHIIVIPISILILTTIHLYKIRKDKGVLPYL